MELPFANEYKAQSSKLANPSDKMPTTQKLDKQWGLQRIKWGYCSYLNNNFSFSYTDRWTMLENRAYGQGMQSVDRYMDRLCPIATDAAGKKIMLANGKFKRKGWYNIDWKILAIAPKFRDRVVGEFMKRDVNIGCFAVDEMSDNERNGLKYKLWAESQEAEYLAFLDAMAGTKPEERNSSVPFIPKSIEELDMLSKMGSFKLGIEIAMEEVLDLSFHISRWNSEIKKQLFEDFYDLGRAATKDYVDPLTQEIKVRYVDPVNLIVHETRSNTYNQIDWAAEPIPTTIANVRAMDPTIPEDELRAAAQRYNGVLGNPFINNWSSNGTWLSQTSYDNFTIWILDGEFKTFDYSKYKIKDINGSQVPFEEKMTYTGKSEPGKQVIDRAVEQWYRFKWIIGTDLLYDYGYQYDIPREEKNEARSSFHIYRCAGKSIGERTKEPIDQIQLTFLRLQNANSKAAPNGISVEASSISNVQLGGEVASPKDILSIYHSTGDLIWKATTHNQQMINGGRKPIETLVGGIGPYLTECMAQFTYYLNILREITGLPAGLDASAPPSEQGLGVTQIQASATNDVLQPIMGGYTFLKEETAKNLCLRAQIVAMFGLIEGYIPGIGDAVTKFIKVGKEITLTKMGIKVEGVVDNEEKAMVMAAASQSLAAAKTGQVGITLSDYFFIMRNVNHGNLKMCEVYLAYREEKMRTDQLAAQAQNQQLNDQNAQAMEQMKGQSQQATIAAETQKEMALENARVQGQLALEREKNRGAKELEADKFSYAMQLEGFKIATQASADIKVNKSEPKKETAAA